MIKGAQKQMIVVRTAASRYFDEAYFVLRGGVNPARGERVDLLAEAQRILSECENRRGSTRKKGRAWLWFILGAAVGAAVACLALVCLRIW